MIRIFDMEKKYSLSAALAGLAILIVVTAIQQIVENVVQQFFPVISLKIVLVLLVIAIGYTLIKTWLRPSFEPKKRAVFIPLYQAARWIARDSKWAATFHKGNDDDWISLVKCELQSHLLAGDLKAWGHYQALGEDPSDIRSEIPREFWEHANWNSHCLINEVPPISASTRSEHGRDNYEDVVMDQNEIRLLWPKRSVWAALLGKSPVERNDRSDKKHPIDHYKFGLKKIWKAQDVNYPRARAVARMTLAEKLYG